MRAMRVTLLGARRSHSHAPPLRLGLSRRRGGPQRAVRLRPGGDLQARPCRAPGRAAISLLLFTHHHFDHNTDYPCLVLSRWDQSVDQTPLRVTGRRRPRSHRTCSRSPRRLRPDWNARVEHPGSQQVSEPGGTLPRLSQIDAVDIDATFALEKEGFSVRAADTMHAQPSLESVAYRIDDEASIVFTGDTEPVRASSSWRAAQTC